MYQKITLLYLYGNTTHQIAKLTGVSIPWTKTIVRRAGIMRQPHVFEKGNLSRSGRPHTSETKQLIRRLKAGNAIDQYYKLYQINASKTKKVFEISIVEFEQVIFSCCVYCGAEPAAREMNSHTIVVNGVDRIDNTIGYVVENITSCCKRCNIMKSNLSKNSFIEHCVKVAKKNGML